MTNKAAWRHPAFLDSVVLPDGETVSAREAIERGYTNTEWPHDQMTMTPHPTERHLVHVARGVSLSRYNALRLGFGVESSAPGPVRPPRSSWRAEIFALPETKGREAAVAELLATQTEDTMPVASARALLRGLPTERTEEPKPVTINTDPRAARKAEIAANMQAFNARNGHKATPSATPNAPVANIEPAKLKRLAEIRLNALERDGVQPVASGETKKLRYALDVHAQTAMPLATVFTQLRVDTSKIIRN